jgi:hypothetical protein
MIFFSMPIFADAAIARPPMPRRLPPLSPMPLRHYAAFRFSSIAAFAVFAAAASPSQI